MDSKAIIVPPEVRKLVYMQFSTKELQWIITCVSQTDRKLAQTIFEERCLLFYQNAFADSPLWQYLPDLQQNGSLVPYFEEVLPKDCSFQNLRTFFLDDSALRPDNVTSFIKDVLKFLTSRRSTKHLQLQIDLNIILGNIDFVVEKLQVQKESILDFLKNPNYFLSERLTIAKAYCEIETCLTVSALLVFGFNYFRNAEDASTALLVTDKYLMRWLSGSSLMWLELTDSNCALMRRLIRCALKEEIDVDLDIEQVEILLSRLSDNELFDYLPADGTGIRRDLLLKVMEKKHPLLHQIGPKTIERMIYKNADKALLCSLLEHLGAEKLSLALSQLSSERFVEIVVNIENEEFIKGLLRNLTTEQLCEMLKPLTSEAFCCLIVSKAFLDLLSDLDKLFPKEVSADPHSEIENQSLAQVNQLEIKIDCGSSALLVRMSKVESFYSTNILKSKAAAYLTEADRLMLEGGSAQAYRGNYHAWPNFTDDEYVIVVPPYPSGYTDGGWNPNVDGPRVEEVDSDSVESVEEDGFVKKQTTPYSQSKRRNGIPLELSQYFLPEAKIPGQLDNQALPDNKRSRKTTVSQKKQASSQQQTPKQLHHAPYQKNLPSTIAWSITKGLFVGVLITGIAILLMMFINYQMDVPLLEIINELWIAGVAGIFAEIVATACFLVDAAKVWGSSNTVSTNEKPDNPKPFDIPTQVTHTANPAYGSNPFSPEVKTVGITNPSFQQTFAQTPVDNQNGMF